MSSKFWSEPTGEMELESPFTKLKKTEGGAHLCQVGNQEFDDRIGCYDKVALTGWLSHALSKAS